MLVVNHTKRNKIDDSYKNQIYEEVDQKITCQIYFLRDIESSEIKRVHLDDIILFKEAADDPLIKSDLKSEPKEKRTTKQPKQRMISCESELTSITDNIQVCNSSSDTIVPATSSSEDSDHGYNLRGLEERRLPIRYG